MTTYTMTARDLCTDERKTRTFTVADHGGYVFEVMPSGERAQVSWNLAHRGEMMSCSGSQLAAQVRIARRREIRAFLHATR